MIAPLKSAWVSLWGWNMPLMIQPTMNEIPEHIGLIGLRFLMVKTSGAVMQAVPVASGAGTFSFITISGNALSQGCVNHTEKWVVRGIYGRPYQPNAPSCEDTSLVSDTISYTVRMTVRPDLKVRYGGTDYGDGSTIPVQPGSVSFTAVEPSV